MCYKWSCFSKVFEPRQVGILPKAILHSKEGVGNLVKERIEEKEIKKKGEIKEKRGERECSKKFFFCNTEEEFHSVFSILFDRNWNYSVFIPRRCSLSRERDTTTLMLARERSKPFGLSHSCCTCRPNKKKWQELGLFSVEARMHNVLLLLLYERSREVEAGLVRRELLSFPSHTFCVWFDRRGCVASLVFIFMFS